MAINKKIIEKIKQRAINNPLEVEVLLAFLKCVDEGKQKARVFERFLKVIK